MLVEIRRKITAGTDTGRLLTGRKRNLSQIANRPPAAFGSAIFTSVSENVLLVDCQEFLYKDA